MNLYHISYTYTPISPKTGQARPWVHVNTETGERTSHSDTKNFTKTSSKVASDDTENAIKKLRAHFDGVPQKYGTGIGEEFTVKRIDTILSVEDLGFIDIL